MFAKWCAVAVDSSSPKAFHTIIALLPSMPVVSEMVHPKGFDFCTQRKIVLPRNVHQFEWADIAEQVKNLKAETPRPRQCANYYHAFSSKLGRRQSNYHRRGPQKLHKITKEVERFLTSRLYLSCVMLGRSIPSLAGQWHSNRRVLYRGWREKCCAYGTLFLEFGRHAVR